MKRALPLLVLCSAALCSTALAESASLRAWSDARSLPPEASFAAKLPSFAACEGADFDRSKVSTDALSAYDNMVKLVTSMKADDPTRLSLEPTLAQMRVNYAKAAPLPAVQIPATLAEALKNAQAWLEKNEAAGWRAFSASEDAKDAKKASQAALAAAMLGKPNAALAALLTAQKLDPQNAQHLVNLGGVLNTLGLTGEALVVLDAAAKVSKNDSGALGWSSAATLNANRGLTLADLRRWPDAEKALTSAVDSEPMLAEARLGLARVLTCQGKTAQAAKFARAGLRRSPSVTPPPAKTTDPQATEPATVEVSEAASAKDVNASAHLPASFTFDLSRGQDFTMPNLKLPQTPGDALALLDKYQKLHDDLHARWESLRKRSEDVEARFRRQPAASPLVQARREALWQAFLHVNDEPTVKRLYDSHHKSDWEVSKADMDFSHCESGCIMPEISIKAATAEVKRALCVPAMLSQNDKWRSAMHAHAENLGAYLKASYKLHTALAANFSDPLWHERASLTAEFLVTTEFMGYVGEALHWAKDIRSYQDCVASAASSVPDKVAEDLLTPRADPCKAVFDNMSLAFSVHVVSFRISCDSMNVTAVTPGWIGAFGSISEKFATKEYTVTVGIQEGASVGVGPATVGVKSQQGAYVSWGASGITDAGVSITTSAKANVKDGATSGAQDVLKDVSGALSDKWSFIASPGGVK
ncbi:tetratricopeptide repeat protein [Deinococcus yavapaiensis]|uniref:Tetratricopeptide repeat protein n=1 Tax=Deinococcus yavapaiensis KR-236 TaxID=694435 RepID=A0A318SLL1_9DEIO|nr:tetratricopeptide repeat protein [Deinococcus yavapaiensis]PYE55419.1 tetratricopeptide repeat protein [Deinococcus yavapaiensis KR-236]